MVIAVLSPYAEAQLAGWVVSPPELVPPIAEPAAAAAERSDPEALLARFYACQEC